MRDRSLLKMTEKDWGELHINLLKIAVLSTAIVSNWHIHTYTDLVHAVHMRGAFMVTRAALPYMRKQDYGRFVCILC